MISSLECIGLDESRLVKLFATDFLADSDAAAALNLLVNKALNDGFSFDIASAYHLSNDSKNAVKYWLKSAEYDKSNPQIYVNLALTYLNEYNERMKALRYIRTAYEYARNDYDVVFKYGLILLKLVKK